MKFKTLPQCIFFLFNLIAVSSAQAEQWYQVDLVVFEQLNSYSDEQWPVTEIPTGTVSPITSNAYIQPATTDALNQIAYNLSKSANYRVHYHQAWQQAMLSKGRAKPVSITSENEMINGTLKLYKMTYLHAEFDLWLMENRGIAQQWSEVSNEGIDITAPRNPNLKESRRIKSKKVFLFDHPRLGALLELTPIATPDAAKVGIEQLESYSLPVEAAPIVAE
jgi:hypothetical protein